MRLAIFDNNILKFAGVLKKHWESKGHTVNYEPTFNPNLVETCDRVFFEMADTNVHLATQRRPHKKGKLFCRIIDVDAHSNGPAGIKPGYIDGLIYIADYIKEMCDRRYQNLAGVPAKVIPMGVDLERFTYQEHTKGNKIAFVATRLSPEKQFDTALWIFAELLKHSSQYELHVVGRMYENSVWEMHINHILDSNNMRDKVKFYGNLPHDTGNEINNFLADKNYLLLTSHKEAFSFCTAEAMAKGIKPIIYNFKGAVELWGRDWLFQTPTEAVQAIVSDAYSSVTYRKYIEDTYPLSKHLQAIDEWMEIS